MSDGIKLDPPGLELAGLTSDTDGRIANLITAVAADTSPEADIARWALESLQRARANLRALEVTTTDPGALALIRAGLEVAPG